RRYRRCAWRSCRFRRRWGCWRRVRRGWSGRRGSMWFFSAMTARNNATTIGPCLEGIRRWADEVIVVDTGSKDETPKMAAKLGARVFHFPWCDSFSRARNESLRHARGKWIFWMDTDDTIDEANGRKLRAIVEGMI